MTLFKWLVAALVAAALLYLGHLIHALLFGRGGL